MVDLDHLENYIVIPLTPKPATAYSDLRELAQDFGVGVAALWSDVAQSIVAFAFNNLWNEAAARQWVKDTQAKAAAAEDKPMPYQTMAEVNPAILGIKPPVTLAQANMIAAWADAMDADEEGPENPWAVALANFKQDYGVKDGAWVKRAQEMHAYDSVLAAGDSAAEAGDGLIWKEIIKPGAWFKMDSGRRIEVTKDIIQEAVRAFQAGLPKLVSVPADSHHADTRGVVPAESNRGFIARLKQIGDSLFGGFRLTDQVVAAGVQEGSIADCSVYLQPDVVHPQTGEKFPWVLRHVLLTNNPLVPDLRGFGDIPAADSENLIVVHYRQVPEKGVDMPEEKQADKVLGGADEIVLTGDAAQEYAALAGLGLTAAEIMELATQRAAIQAQAADLRDKARAMEITRVVKALEGKDEHPGVVHIAGRVHFPVVVAAVEKALREAPAALALDGDAAGVTDLDTALLAVVNAIPEDARLAVQAEDVGGDKRAPKPTTAAGEVTDAQIDQFLSVIS